MKTHVMLAAIGTLALAGAALANEPKTYNGPGGPLNDTDDQGIPAVTRFEIFVPDSGEIKGIGEVLLTGLTHTWAGDLKISLTHKDTGTTVVLVDRPGATLPPPDEFGEDENYGGNYSFQDGFAPIPDEFPGTLGLPSGTYGPVDPLASFVGENKLGAWSLIIEDFAVGDTGALGGWSITFLNIPAPGALALLGVAGLAARRRRRS